MITKVTVGKRKVREEWKWAVSFRENGKRRRLFFGSQAEADAKAEDIRFERSEAGAVFAGLTKPEREMIMLAAADFKARGGNLAFALSRSEPTQEPASGPSLRTVIDELVELKEKAGRADRYTTGLRIVLDQFAKGLEHLPVAKITVAEIEKFLDSKSLAYRSTLRSRISTMFKFAVRRRYRLDNPCEQLEAVTYVKPPPQIFTPAQFETAVGWLKKNAPRGLAWFALSSLCGLRPEEAEKTVPERDINFTEGYVKVEAQTTKVRERRVVYPKPEAMALLQWALKKGGKLPFDNQARGRVLAGSEAKPRLREALGFKTWPKDITRHTAASYWLASNGSAAHVSDMLGNSEKVLKRDYKAMVTKAEAKTFWKVVSSFADARKPARGPAARKRRAGKSRAARD